MRPALNFKSVTLARPLFENPTLGERTRQIRWNYECLSKQLKIYAS
jgi:hypothetical protein